MEQLTTYRAIGKTIGLLFLFKYDLNGNLRAFVIEEGELNEEQIGWLFSTNFPATERIMKTVWMSQEKYMKVFKVEVSPADLSFEALWIIWDYKIAKQDAIRAVKKLNESELIEVFIDAPKYKQWLKYNPKIPQMHLATYINGKRFQDERPMLKGKNFNPVLTDLATKKTDK